ncbi:hypothetical protein [Devosia oryzisoli]|nr:hypothetical protein [Devosia oryzisoli]
MNKPRIPSEVLSTAAYASGLGVIIPSLIALALSLFAVAATVF